MIWFIYDHIGGQTMHVGDCQVWASIFYLDSPTDYREYLPLNGDVLLINPGEELIMLDDLHSPWNMKKFVNERKRQFLKILHTLF